MTTTMGRRRERELKQSAHRCKVKYMTLYTAVGITQGQERREGEGGGGSRADTAVLLMNAETA